MAKKIDPFCLASLFFQYRSWTTPRRFEPLSWLLKRLRASMKMSNFERKYSPRYHMICIGKTKSINEKVCYQYSSSKNSTAKVYGNEFKINDPIID